MMDDTADDTKQPLSATSAAGSSSPSPDSANSATPKTSFQASARPLLSHFENDLEARDYNPNETDELFTERSRDSFTEGMGDVQSKYSELIRDKIVEFSKKRFRWLCGLGVVALIILSSSFLPRTSLSRDYRRWHNSSWTKADVERNFMMYSGEKSFDEHSNSEHIDWLLQNFTALNSKNPTNLLAEDNVPLTRFVEHKFQNFGFRTSVHSYEVDLPKPLDAKLVLYDKENGQKVYSANLLEPKFSTPSYYGFGVTASFKGDYVFANNGSQQDYELLTANGVSVKGKTVIIKSCMKSEMSIGEKVGLAERYEAAGLVHYTDFSDKAAPNKKIDSRLASAVQRDTAVKSPFGTNNFQKAKIPVLPVSYNAIEPILNTFIHSKKLKGWDYAAKSTDFELEIDTVFDDKKRRLTNIVGNIDGIINDGDIIIGASRDSFDSSNPLSGHVVLLEIMRHFHNLVVLGWKPLRNIKFVSFDGARNGQLGPQKFLEDGSIKKNVLAYLNIDDDAVRGSEFIVDAHPMLNSIIRKVSTEIRVSKETKAFKSLPNTSRYNNPSEEDELSLSLLRYWERQNEDDVEHRFDQGQFTRFIGNDLGRSVYKTNGFPFQYHATVPVMNVKFGNDPKRDSSVYVSNSNYYSYDWLVKQEIDDGFVLHRVLIRYLGRIIITLSEREVVDFNAYFYFNYMQQRVWQFLKENEDALEVWADKDITEYLDLSFFNLNVDEFEIKEFRHLVYKFRNVCFDIHKSRFHSYIYDVQRGLMQDRPWYRKVLLWIQFKVCNYKMLHVERDLSQEDDDTGTVTDWFNHVFYNNPLQGGILGDLQTAVDSGSLETTVKTMLEFYDKMEWLYKKLGK